MDRIIMHIDANNAFLSWSALDLLNKGYNKDIRNTYAVIGGDESKRSGIVLAKSILAKKKGVITGETLYSAKKKCPELKVYSSNYHFYSLMSNKLFSFLLDYTPDIEIASIDECYLDYGKVKKLYGDEVEFAYKIKNQIFKELGFTVNIGIANNKLCAKMASDFSKPNQVHTLYDYEVKEKMYPLKVGELFGVGKKTTEKLINLGINTIGDLASCNPDYLYKYFKNMASSMIKSAQGIDDSLVISEEIEPKGIGNEITSVKNLVKKEEAYEQLLALAEKVAVRLRKQKKYAYVVVVVLKDKYFKRTSHQKKLKNATNITKEIYETAKQIFNEMWDHEPIRLIGIRLDNLTDTQVHQVSLFEDFEERKLESNLNQVVDDLKDKYGYKIVKKASLVNKTNIKE